MTWISFIYLYSLGALVLFLVTIPLLRGEWKALVRTILLSELLLILGDMVAEERSIWFIPHPSGLFILSTPLENFLLVLATLMTSLFSFLLLLRCYEKYRQNK